MISEIELRRLLHELKDQSSHIGIRFRMIGEMWHVYHNQVVRLTDKGVVLYEKIRNKIIVVPDLKNVMQFELDATFQNYQPFFHYAVGAKDSVIEERI